MALEGCYYFRPHEPYHNGLWASEYTRDCPLFLLIPLLGPGPPATCLTSSSSCLLLPGLPSCSQDVHFPSSPTGSDPNGETIAVSRLGNLALSTGYAPCAHMQGGAHCTPEITHKHIQHRYRSLGPPAKSSSRHQNLSHTQTKKKKKLIRTPKPVSHPDKKEQKMLIRTLKPVSHPDSIRQTRADKRARAYMRRCSSSCVCARGKGKLRECKHNTPPCKRDMLHTFTEKAKQSGVSGGVGGGVWGGV